MDPNVRPDGYFNDRGRWYYRTHDSVMGPFADRAEAQMAVLYFRQRMKWPSLRQLHEFMGGGPPALSGS